MSHLLSNLTAAEPGADGWSVLITHLIEKKICHGICTKHVVVFFLMSIENEQKCNKICVCEGSRYLALY